MITLTERAALALDELALKTELPPGEGIKLVANGNEIALIAGAPEDGDQVLRRGNETLLIVGHDIATAVDSLHIAIDCEIEVVDGQAKTEFHFLSGLG
jgi:hypothetical protein